MKTYEVIVTADTTMSITVQVEADSPEEAEDIAPDHARLIGGWELDDGNEIEPYIPDLGNCATLVED